MVYKAGTDEELTVAATHDPYRARSDQQCVRVVGLIWHPGTPSNALAKPRKGPSILLFPHPLSALMHFLYFLRALVQRTIYRCRDGERAAYHGAHAHEEAGEGLGANLAIDDLHWGDVLRRGLRQRMQLPKGKTRRRREGARTTTRQ